MEDFTKLSTANTAVGFDAGLRSFMVRVYKYMCLALLITGGFAFGAANSEAFLNMVLPVVDSSTGARGQSPLFFVIAIAPMAPWAVYFFSGGRLSYQMTHVIFWAYAVLMGLSMFSIFYFYTPGSIVKVFFITAATFGGMALYGYTTKRDLTGVGSFLIMGMWGLLIASVVNIFLKSAAFDFALSLIGVVVFTGLVAYMNQQLKTIYYSVAGNAQEEGKASVFGAMTLYITFINLFISLLRILGDRR